VLGPTKPLAQHHSGIRDDLGLTVNDTLHERRVRVRDTRLF
jgi:hypothetical protein